MLKKGLDTKKDQSYFLYRLTQKQLSKILFPLGYYHKSEVEKIALRFNFQDLIHKPESQDFFEDGNYSNIFNNKNIPSGDIIDISGNVIGKHNGIIHYTIGQRKGLFLKGYKHPMYVVNVDSSKNRITAGQKEYLLSKKLIATDLHWILFSKLKNKLKLSAKIRLNQPATACEVIPLNNFNIEVNFKEPQFAITPGQSIVFYNNDIVIGGGIIL